VLPAGLAAAPQLECVGCEVGFYLDAENETHGACRRCPAHSTTPPGQNAFDRLHCVCEPGFAPGAGEDSACAACGAGAYKPLLGNHTCTPCPAEAHTNGTGKIALADCLCNPGFTLDAGGAGDAGDAPGECVPCAPGTFKGGLGDGVCDVCPQDHYCPGNTVVPEQCPGDSVSAPGSDALADCACVSGFYAIREPTLRCEPCGAGTYNERRNQSACTACPVDTFNPDAAAHNASLCRACDPNAAAAAGSAAATDCLCRLGYAGAPGAGCVACAPGFFRADPAEYICEACPADSYNGLGASDSAGDCLPCPANSSSGAGSGGELDCVCDPGHFFEAPEPGDVFYRCTACPAGTFAPRANSSGCTECPAGSESAAVGAAEDVCRVCLPGWYSLHGGSAACLPCAASTYQNASVPGVTALPCARCPANSSHALSAQTDVEACRCAPGFRRAAEGTDGYRCEACAAGFYCPGDGDEEPCAPNHYAEAGASACTRCHPNSHGGRIASVSECLCVAGTEGSFDANCSLCAAGKFQAANFSGEPCAPCAAGSYAPAEGLLGCAGCPGNASSPPGSDEAADCLCEAGFFGPPGGPCARCTPGFFCPGGGLRQQCRQHSNSVDEQQAEADCACDPGYVGVEPGASCRKCPPGFYCHGGLHVERCSNHSFSRAGSPAVEACLCDPGMWRGCVVAANGSAFNSAGSCVVDYHLACFECGPNDICVNSTLEHCPPHSAAASGSSDPHDCVCLGGFHRVPVLDETRY